MNECQTAVSSHRPATNLYDAVSHRELESSRMRCPKKLHGALSRRNYAKRGPRPASVIRVTTTTGSPRQGTLPLKNVQPPTVVPAIGIVAEGLGSQQRRRFQRLATFPIAGNN